MATETLVKITGGPSTITFYDGLTVPTGAGYRLNRYTPAVSDLAEDDAGGRGNYKEVVESLSVTVIGTSVPDCFSKIHALLQALEQSERFARGERNLAAVNLQYSPKGGTVSTDTNPLNRMLLGQPPGGEPMWELPEDFELLAGTNLVARDIQIRVRAQGEWLYTKPTTGSTTTERITSGANAENAVIKDLTFTGTAPIGRYPLAYHGVYGGSGGSYTNGIILIARKNGSVNNIAVGSAGGTAIGAPFTNQNDAANLPRQGTTVLRYTPTTTLLVLTQPILTFSQMQRVPAILHYINNSTTTSYKVRAVFTPVTAPSFVSQYSAWETIPPGPGGGGDTQFLIFSPVALTPALSYTLAFELVPSAASGTLDMNLAAVYNEGDPYTQAIVFSNGGRANVFRSPLVSDDLDIFALANPTNALTDTHETAPTSAWAPPITAIRPLYGFGNTMQVLALVTTGIWAVDNAGAVATIDHRLFRRLTYLTPQ